MGAFGHPEDSAQRGKVPGFPDWSYLFHGRGCCLTNESDGTEIDVDFDDDGASTRIDPYFYTNFLDSLKNPSFPEWLIKKPSALHNYWQQDLTVLENLGCWEESQITALGMRLSDALEPIIERLSKMHGDIQQLRQAVFLSLQLGDQIHAANISKPEILQNALIQEIRMEAHQAKTSRATNLSPIVRRETQRFGIPLQALAELGPEFSKAEAIECLFHSPVDGAANAALEILQLWQQADLDSVLEELIEFRAAETDSSFVSKLLRWKKKQIDFGDAMSRDSLFTKTTRLILLRQGKQLQRKTKALLLNNLKNIRTASQGKAAFIVYLLDEKAGLEALGQALVSKVPMANYEASAACVLIGTSKAKELLIRTLRSPKMEQQHAAACALSRFHSSAEIPELSNWMRVQDGIADPIGRDTQIGSRTVQTYSMSDVTHSNMQSHINWAIDSMEDLVPLLKKG